MSDKIDSLFDQRRTIWVIANKLADILLVAIFWTLTSLPIITIGASSTATYYVCLKMARNEDGYIWRNFWKSFKQNFVQATILWIVQLVIGIGLFMAAYFYYSQETKVSAGIMAFLIGMIIVWLLVSIYLPPIICRFSNTTGRLFTSALFMPFKAFKWTCLLLPMALLSLFLAYFILPYPIIAYGVYAACTSKIFIKVFKPYEDMIKKRDGIPIEEDEDNEQA